jgi:hypothetical protein
VSKKPQYTRTSNTSYYRKLELDDGVLAHSATALTNALQGGKRLTRSELAAALEQAGIIRTADDRLAYLLRVCSVRQ